MENDNLEKKWQEAYLEIIGFAHVGMLFRGIMHNMNGMLQSITMQAELSDLYYSQQFQLLAGSPDHIRSEMPVLIDKCKNGNAIINAKLLEIDKFSIRANGIYEVQNQETCDFCINEIIETEIAFLSANRFFKHNVRKDLDLGPDIPLLHGPKLFFHNLIFMVLQNSLEAVNGQPDAHVMVISQKNAESIIIHVEDNGPGISADIHDSIFKPFFSTKSNHPGLGLFLAGEQIKKWNGTLALQQSDPGKTVFILHIPIPFAARENRF